MNNENLTTGQRANRILFGTAVIVFTMLINIAPLGWFAILPLLATYPIFAGIYGNDPVTNLAKRGYTGAAHALSHLHIGGHRSRHV
ncbi:hypothetical protein [Kaarinaea lacus]